MATELDPLAMLEEEVRRVETRRLYLEYGDLGAKGAPYEFQQRFHAMGADHDQRMLLAGNRTGKSRTCAAETSCHLTGWYPKWWVGHRFVKHIECLVAGESNESTRDISQRALLGDVGEDRRPDGTGWIPVDLIGKVDFRQCGVPNVVESAKIRHTDGRWSVIKFRSYEQGWSKFQGVSFDLAWPDEEPEDPMILSEIQTRLLDRKGHLIASRTPLFGKTDWVSHFMDGGDGVGYVTAGLEDAPHIDAEAREKLISRWPQHERECRSKGIPMMGEGVVFPVSDDEIMVDPFPIPDYWGRICGIDFGIDHAQAACWLAHDRDSDVVYVTDCYKASGQNAATHAAAVNSRGEWIPVAWPHDGMNKEKGTGKVLIEYYDLPGRLARSARWEEDKGGGQSKERAALEVLERMQTGRWKVFRTCGAWMEEKRMYHRKNGKIVDVKDDLLSAGFYGLMDLRWALAKTGSGNLRQDEAGYDHDPLSRFVTR